MASALNSKIASSQFRVNTYRTSHFKIWDKCVPKTSCHWSWTLYDINKKFAPKVYYLHILESYNSIGTLSIKYLQAGSQNLWGHGWSQCPTSESHNSFTARGVGKAHQVLEISEGSHAAVWHEFSNILICETTARGFQIHFVLQNVNFYHIFTL